MWIIDSDKNRVINTASIESMQVDISNPGMCGVRLETRNNRSIFLRSHPTEDRAIGDLNAIVDGIENNALVVRI